jgi:transcriptional regulator with XRE-family HTH domain
MPKISEGRRALRAGDRELAVAMGARVRKLREALGWTQGELASRTGISASQVSYLEAGKRTFPVHQLVRAAAELGVTAAYLVGSAPETPLGVDVDVDVDVAVDVAVNYERMRANPGWAGFDAQREYWRLAEDLRRVRAHREAVRARVAEELRAAEEQVDRVEGSLRHFCGDTHRGRTFYGRDGGVGLAYVEGGELPGGPP